MTRGGRGFSRTEEGVTVGAHGGMMYVEGRLAAILRGADDHALCGPSELVAGARRAAVLAGVDPEEPAAVGRLDLASELTFEDGEHGRRFLSALSALEVPWLKSGTEGGKRSGLETVYWRTALGRSVVLRAYDKARESKQGEPGTRIRVERQRRYRREREELVATVASRRWASLYVGRELVTLLDRAPDVHEVGDVPEAVQELRSRVGRGELRGQAAERLIGYLTLRGAGLPARTVQRRERELALLGLAVKFSASADRVPVRPLLAELVDAWAA